MWCTCCCNMSSPNSRDIKLKKSSISESIQTALSEPFNSPKNLNKKKGNVAMTYLKLATPSFIQNTKRVCNINAKQFISKQTKQQSPRGFPKKGAEGE